MFTNMFIEDSSIKTLTTSPGEKMSAEWIKKNIASEVTSTIYIIVLLSTFETISYY